MSEGLIRTMALLRRQLQDPLVAIESQVNFTDLSINTPKVAGMKHNQAKVPQCLCRLKSRDKNFCAPKETGVDP